MDSEINVEINMILIYAVILGLAATLVRARLFHRTLKITPMRWGWLVFVCVVPQILVFYLPYTAKIIPESMIPPLQILSMFGLSVFAFLNISLPGFWALGLGLVSNFLAILANGGWMPIRVETLQRMIPSRAAEFWTVGSRLGFTKDRIMAPEVIRLEWLTDRFTFPQGLPQNIAFSLGDIFISIGVILLLWSLSREEGKEKL